MEVKSFTYYNYVLTLLSLLKLTINILYNTRKMYSC